MINKIIIIVILIFSFFSFFKINEINYSKHNEIKTSIIKHPENLPEKNIAITTSFWYKNLKADMYWLKTIQYIWANAVHSEYKKYLYYIIDLVTDLNPFFEKPYIIGQLLLPSYNQNYDIASEKEQKINIEQAELIWIKWVNNFCDKEKIKLIENEENLLKIWNNDEFSDPCKSYKIPYYLAYIYYNYKNDPLTSAKYYKISSANKDSLDWSKIMAAIMQWKWWEREKSFFMFLNLASFIDSEDKVCNIFSKELENIWIWVFMNKNINLDGKLIKNLEDLRKKAFWHLKIEDILEESKCANYINKSIRELNLEYVERWNKKYFLENKVNSINAKELFDKWYIETLPIDFQQSKDYWIIYIFNKDTWKYDYDMGKY